MKPWTSPFHFPGFLFHRFEIGGKRYRLRLEDWKVLQMISALDLVAHAEGPATRLLPYRNLIREIPRHKPREALIYVLIRADNPILQRIAIWLRGRCGGKWGISAILPYCQAEDIALRKEAVRCLKRMKAWTELRTFAAVEQDDRIRRIATAMPIRSYAERLSGFTENVTPLPQITRETPLYLAAEVDLGHKHLPKQRWWIRRILERIHRFVHGAQG